jgi:hypothetical protein
MVVGTGSGTCAITRGAILGIPPWLGTVRWRSRNSARHRRDNLASLLFSCGSHVLGLVISESRW